MISASAVTTRHELIMSLVAGLSLIMQGVKPNGQLNNDENPCHGTDFFLFWAMRQDFTQIYGQTGIFEPFVRKQNAFYGQTGFFQ